MRSRLAAFVSVLLYVITCCLPSVAQDVPRNRITVVARCGVSGDDSLVTVRHYDGLGRPVEVVEAGASPGGSDLVTLTCYDGAGRVSRLWNKAACGHGGGYVEPSRVSAACRSQYGDAAPYGTFGYEQSALGRACSSTGPGKDWHDNGRYVRLGRLLNNEDVDSLSCRMIAAHDTRLAADTSVVLIFRGHYPTGTLHVARTADEDGAVSLVFTDRSDRTVLERRMLAGGRHSDTYYVYDSGGRLTAVLPPAAVPRLPLSGQVASRDAAALGAYAYLYAYDPVGLCRARKLPGCAWQLYVHDAAGRVVLSQDGTQRGRGEWAFVVRDVFGRECLTGLCQAGTDVLGQTLCPLTMHAVRDASASAMKGYAIRPAQGAVLQSPRLLRVMYYDDYRFPGAADSALAYRPAHLPDRRYTGGSVTFLTGELTAVLDATDTTFLRSAYYYDSSGRVIQSCRDNILGGTDRESVAYDFTGNVVSRIVSHSPAGISEEHLYVYDHAGRLESERLLVGGTSVVIAACSYDEVGRLRSVSRDGGSGPTEYAYNVRSWPVEISGPWHKETLYYNDGPGLRRYDGNVSARELSRADGSGIFTLYAYDALKRLSATACEGTGDGSDFSTSYGYDAMGNLTSLERRGLLDDGSYGAIDAVSLEYDGNRLLRATDAAAAPTYNGVMHFTDGSRQEREYCYDADGRLTCDLNRGLRAIRYNAIGMPASVSTPLGGIAYTYSADGRRLLSTYNLRVMAGSSLQALAPATAVGGVQRLVRITDAHCGNLVYHDGKPSKLLFNGGYVGFTDGGVQDMYFVFFHRDHLGSNVVSTLIDGSPVETCCYYPYGVLQADGPADYAHPYKYNGKELDRMLGLDWMDYGSRWYAPVLCRWMTVDPLCEEHYDVSPYAYCLDNPVNMTDKDGLNPIFNHAGDYLGCSKDGFSGTIYIYEGPETIDWSANNMSYWLDSSNGYSESLYTYDDVEAAYSPGSDHADFAYKVINKIAEHFDGTELFGDRTFTMSSLLDGEIKFSEDDTSNFTTLRKHAGIKTSVTFHGRTAGSYEGTVENFAATMLVHEWYSHGEYYIGSHHRDRYGNKCDNHYLAYRNVMNDDLFYPKTTEKYKKFVSVMEKDFFEKHQSDVKKNRRK